MESNVNLHSRYEHDVYHIIGGFIHCIKKTIKNKGVSERFVDWQ